MKNLFLLSTLLISFSSFGQGLVMNYYESGAVESKANYVDGKRQGEYFEYYESGAVKAKKNYVNGVYIKD